MTDDALPSHAPHEPAAPKWPSRWRRALPLLVGIYVVAIAGLWLWMTWDSDRGWAATLVLFGPRWLCALPLPLLATLAAVYERKLLPPLAIAAVVILLGIMGFNVGLPKSASGQRTLRILTCNVEKKAIRPELLAKVIDDVQADIVALQEFFRGTPLIWPADWHVIERHEFILASRFPIVERDSMARPGHPWELAGMGYTLTLPEGEVHVFNLHLESPRVGLEAVLSRRKGIDFGRTGELTRAIEKRALESERTARWIAEQPGPKLVVGDFNMPPESAIFRRDWSGYDDAFSRAGFGFGFTKNSEKDGWSYGARIDHILVNAPWRVLRARVCGNVGSDHLPLVAEAELAGPQP
jgi:endonuclease/exonuclease/phosphatase (EEP) superfamily protein YafD